MGAWVLLETLTALHGRKSGTDFVAYLAPSKLAKLGLGNRHDTKAIRDAVGRVSKLGNATKHAQIAAAFNSKTLANDFETMDPMLVSLGLEVAK